MMEPPGRWVWVVPETGWTARGGNFNELVKVVRGHYSGNGIVCDNVEETVETGLCTELLGRGAAHFVAQTVNPPKARDVYPPSTSLTVAYLTNRKHCKIEWFYESLARQLPEGSSVHIIVVDFWADEPGRREEMWQKYDQPAFHDGGAYWTHVAPKPNVWSGPHRLTSVDYFSAANSRNTALCLAKTDWIAYVDDLSVLCSGWLNSVYQAMRESYIALGSYKKVRKLVVRDGYPESCEDFPSGWDNRLAHVQADLSSCAGNWLFGCSFAAPVQALLDVGGSPEMCDSTGLGSEDYCLGIALANRGHSFRYDRRMMTLESEEGHHNPDELKFKRSDKGVSPNDKSHAMLAYAQGANYFPNGLTPMRAAVQAGLPFPIPTEPTTDWYDGQPLSEL
jgi:hypothetical protein